MMKARIGLVQMTSGIDILGNIETAAGHIRHAAAQGAQFVATPEMTSLVDRDAERLMAKVKPEAQDPALQAFSQLAKELGIELLIGSLPILLPTNRVANRSYLINPEGQVRAYYDKIHLFDVSVGRGEEYRESKTYEAGDKAVLADCRFGPLGLSICYDVRFGYLYRLLAQAGARILTVPSAFTRPTGMAHWHVLLRARAIENGAFVIAPAQYGTHQDGRRTYGHSVVIDPWGEVLLDAADVNGAHVIDLDLEAVDRARNAIPSLTHDRDVQLVDNSYGAQGLGE